MARNVLISGGDAVSPIATVAAMLDSELMRLIASEAQD
jgi:hypothetical protein